MTAPAVQPMPRETAPSQYDRLNEQRYRQQVDEELLQKFDKRSDLRLGRGKSLVLSSASGIAYSLSLTDSGILTVTDIGSGETADILIDWDSIGSRPANLVALDGTEGIITIENTAAAITGQGTLATASAVTWATQVTGVGKPEDDATKSRVFRQDSSPSSPNVNDIWVQTTGGGVTPQSVRAWNGSAWVTGADITLINTAAAITGQGWGATAAESAASNALVPLGSNLFVDSEFQRGLYAWQAGFAGNTGLPHAVSINTYGAAARVYYSAVVTGTPSAGTFFDVLATKGSYLAVELADSKRFCPPVNAGDRIYIGAQLSGDRITAAAVRVVWLDSTGNGISNVLVASALPAATAISSITTWTRIGGFATAPAGACYALFFVRVTCSGGANPYCSITSPMFAKVPANQTEAPPYQPGRPDPIGDQTNSNTAAAITSQGNLATANNGRGTTAARPAATGSWGLYANTDTRFLQADVPSSGWVNIAALPVETLTVTVSPTSGSGERIGAGVVTISGFTVSVSGGSGSYGYTYTPSAGVTRGGTNTAPTFSYTVAVAEKYVAGCGLLVNDLVNGRNGFVAIDPLTFREVTADP